MGIKYGGRSTTGAPKRTDVSGAAETVAWRLPELRLLELMEELEPALKGVVRQALFGETGRFEKFASTPSSVCGHHSVRGGNLLHTIDVAECALMMADRYEGLVDKQVVLAAALLHDLGKCEEYEDARWGTTMSDSGGMVGHKVIGCGMLWAALEQLGMTNDRLALSLLNAVASSSGRSYELRGPATLEAIIVSKADQLSAAADLFRESLDKSGQFQGVKHRHMKEQPRHPVALVSAPAQAPAPAPAFPHTQAPRLTRAQRFGDR